ncbi:GLPGLI family protein [Aquimarina brevivitae]|uniref:GLPGLI family protein n=1 Tax=Aquimarina brevivitae TaxID=323412 RepID=A0A4Q7PFL3_9FLAO|nr:GLPGLI family protein [Aquimarina brevivitae]RZS99266.1 GLPGLI family protein [Aquimarina brevivitae]
MKTLNLKIVMLLFIVVSYPLYTYGQDDIKGVIYYKGINEFKILPKYEEKDSLGNYVAGATARIYQNMKSRNKPVEFKLVFSDKESIFYMNDELTLQSERRNPTRKSKKEEIFYVNHNNKKVSWRNEYAGKLFLIESSLDTLKWSILEESKMIGKFKCFKARTVRKAVDFRSKEIMEEKITVWFTPELPYQYGPEAFYGLPGLVLEMNIGAFKYAFDSINLKPENEEINKPIEGKTVTHQEYMKYQQNSNLIDILRR